MYFSQFGEDKGLSTIFSDIGKGVCVEVGANDGIHGSTTLYFERLGWDCLLIEPNPALADQLRQVRTGRVFECAASSAEGVATLQLAEGDGLAHAVSTIETGAEAEATLRRHGASTRPVEVATRRLDSILKEAGVQSIEFLSIDVEGHELAVLKGFSLSRWRPRIMIIEDNTGFRDSRVRDHLRQHGYVRFRRTGVNDWYARADDHALVRKWRRFGYARTAAAASSYLTWVKIKLKLARVPGVLPLARRLKRLGRG